MTISKAFLVGALLIASTFRVREAQAQSLESTLTRLRTSQVDTAKENAFSALLSLGAKDQFAVCSPTASISIRRALIFALSKENDFLDAGGPLSEVDTEYYAKLIGCVATLRDRTAIQALVGAIETGGGAIDGIVVLGEEAVPALLALLNSREPRGRVAALVAAGKLVGRNPYPQAVTPSAALSESAIGALRAKLLGALGDDNPFARIAAIRSLQHYSDAEVRHAIEEVAAKDPAVRDNGAPERDYPVRREAEEWLKRDKLKSRPPPF